MNGRDIKKRNSEKVQVSYWIDQLAEMPAVLGIFGDYPRPPVQSFFRNKQQIELEPTLSEQLNSFCARENIPSFVVLLSSFQLILRCYTGQDDIVIGTASVDSIRWKSEVSAEQFVNPLALRFRLEGDPTVYKFLQFVAQVVTDASQNRDYPYDELLVEIGGNDDPSRGQIFQTMVLFLGAHTGISLRPVSSDDLKDIEEYTTRCDLTLQAQEENGRLQIICEYDVDLFIPSSIQRILTHLQRILNEIVSNSDQLLSNLPHLSKDERQRMLFEWNNTQVNYSEEHCVHHLFENQCESTPNTIAIVAGNNSLSYQELNSRANQVAHYLIELGVGTETLVGVGMGRSLDMLVVLLGILKAGGTYVPLDLSIPPERLAFILKDTKISVLLASRGFSTQSSSTSLRVIHPEIEWQEISKRSKQNLNTPVTGSNLVYVIYTSGSTGSPKGVQIEHRSVVNLLLDMQNQLCVTEKDVLLATTTLSFDISALELFLPLIVGARIVMANENEVLSGTKLLEHLSHNTITIMQGTPVTWQLLLDAGWLDRTNLKILCGGEVFPRSLANQLLNRSASVWNMYGPTETTIWSCTNEVAFGDGPVPIGRPVANTRIYLLDRYLQPVPIGAPGEVYIGGNGLARGYINNPHLTAERFIPDSYSGGIGARLYKTGDLARFQPDGTLEFLGRSDYQVKIRGHRIELGEIETILAQHSSVEEVIVLVRDEVDEEKLLVAYIVPKPEQSIAINEIRAFLRVKLPEFMIPNSFVIMTSLPLSPNRKINRRALPKPELKRKYLSETFAPPRNEIEKSVALLWQDALEIDKVGINDNFFDLGGHSLLLSQIHSRIQQIFHTDLSIIDMLKYPTVYTLARRLEQEIGVSQSLVNESILPTSQVNNSEVAIIGMAGRFPGARNLNTYWDNLQLGKESISFFSNQELLASGIDLAILNNKNYVNASAVLDDYDKFDAAFFGLSAREANLTDPQHRIFLECAWEALENAGYDSSQNKDRIGVFAGASMNTYLLALLVSNPNIISATSNLALMIGNDKDFLATRVSYKLNLKGPSIVVQTACSTSLVAVHLACKNLLNNECDMALAGGVSIRVPHNAGYLYQDGGIYSPDGHCRTFDARSQGTVFGSGVGIVVLKRLADALRDRDYIHAVIKGSSVNNDGSDKIGYTAPSVEGQTRVIRDAHKTAVVPPESITYVELHGTGTSLGDPIEVAALSQAFRYETKKNGFCAIGSVKTNIGHLDAAAGVAGLIKTILALEHRLIPPSINFELPNPRIDFLNSPFYVNTALAEWTAGSFPRRAGVSSLGIGGTNAHVVLEEAPIVEPSSHSRPYQLLTISAKSKTALEMVIANLIKYLQDHPDIKLPDFAYTLMVGRHKFNYRRSLVCQNVENAITTLQAQSQRTELCYQEATNRPVIFMFPGQGTQYQNMTRELYGLEPVFHKHFDICAEILVNHLGLDIRKVLYPAKDEMVRKAQSIDETFLTQPLLFTVEYSLAQLWMSWGVMPQAMIGHSIGEYVAACLSGVLSLEDILALIAIRGKLMQDLPFGAMLAVNLSEKEIISFLSVDTSLSLAAVNSSSSSVISGPIESIEHLKVEFVREKIPFRHLQVSHAFHSAMMEPMMDPFYAHISKFQFHEPRIPYISNITGTWITPKEAMEPLYWSKHLRQTVRFSDGLQELLNDPERIFLEVGPGRTLSAIIKRQLGKQFNGAILTSLHSAHEVGSDVHSLLDTLGQLWQAGAKIDGAGLYGSEQRCRIPLPTYPFERQRYWMDQSNDVGLDVTQRYPIATESKQFSTTNQYRHFRPNLRNAFIAPRNKFEERLIIIWEDVLGIQGIGIDDNFFELGGDSLIAIELVERIRTQIQWQLTIVIFFENATIRQLASLSYPGMEDSNV